MIYKEQYKNRVSYKQFLMIQLYLLTEIESGYVKSYNDRGEFDDDNSEYARSGVTCMRIFKDCEMKMLCSCEIINYLNVVLL